MYKKMWIVLFLGFSSLSALQKVVFTQERPKPELYQKHYAWLLKRLPLRSQQLFFDIVEGKKDVTLFVKKEHMIIPDTKKAQDIISWYDLFIKAGGTGKVLDALQFDNRAILFNGRNFKLFSIRILLGKLLSAILAQSEELKMVYDHQYIYFSDDQRTIYQGARMYKQYSEKNCSLRHYEAQNYELCGGEKAFKKGLVGFYKIHLMPQEEEILHVVAHLIEALKKNPELQKLIDIFKIEAALWVGDKITDQSLITLLGDQYRPAIVIYPSSGKENVQKLLDALLLVFKDFKGSGNIPRYNLQVNDLLFYAQGDGDDKMNQDIREKYFDPKTNYALYRPDFEKLMIDLKKPYKGKDLNPYALKIPKI